MISTQEMFKKEVLQFPDCGGSAFTQLKSRKHKRRNETQHTPITSPETKTKYPSDIGGPSTPPVFRFDFSDCHSRNLVPAATKKRRVDKSPLSGERPYACPLCRTRFKKPKNLKSHQSTHLGDARYWCEICRVKFRTLQALNFHKRQLHETEDTPKRHVQRKSNIQAKKPRRQVPIYVRRTPNEDPHLWPKVMMSSSLNDILLKVK